MIHRDYNADADDLQQRRFRIQVKTHLDIVQKIIFYDDNIIEDAIKHINLMRHNMRHVL